MAGFRSALVALAVLTLGCGSNDSNEPGAGGSVGSDASSGGVAGTGGGASGTGGADSGTGGAQAGAGGVDSGTDAGDSGVIGFCGTPLETPAVKTAPTPVTGAPLSGIELFDGWTDPRALPAPVNSSGWEDSAFISNDGTTLYFGYSQWNFDALQAGQLVIDGPPRPGEKGPAFDIFEATLTSTGFDTTISTVNSDGDVPEAAIGVDAKRSLMAFVRFVGAGDVYLSCATGTGWSVPAVALDAVNTPCIEDNPQLSEDGATLWFDSNRADAAGTSCKADSPENRSVWVSRFDGTSWGAPTPVTGGLTGGALVWQVFTQNDGETIYWTGRDTDCADSVDCLYRAARTSGDDYGAPTLVARAKPAAQVGDGDVLALGEMSITGDGAFLYFVYLQQTGPATHDLGIGVAHR